MRMAIPVTLHTLFRLPLLIAAMAGLVAQPALADSVGQVQTTKYFAPETVAPPHDTQGTARPVDRKWTFPSADSIPPVSIMRSEPALPKAAELPEPKADPDLARSLGVTPEPAKPAEAPRLPPKRPQSEAAPSPEPR